MCADEKMGVGGRGRTGVGWGAETEKRVRRVGRGVGRRREGEIPHESPPKFMTHMQRPHQTTLVHATLAMPLARDVRSRDFVVIVSRATETNPSSSYRVLTPCNHTSELTRLAEGRVWSRYPILKLAIKGP